MGTPCTSIGTQCLERNRIVTDTPSSVEVFEVTGYQCLDCAEVTLDDPTGVFSCAACGSVCGGLIDVEVTRDGAIMSTEQETMKS